jgi:hypothetical protein
MKMLKVILLLAMVGTILTTGGIAMAEFTGDQLQAMCDDAVKRGEKTFEVPPGIYVITKTIRPGLKMIGGGEGEIWPVVLLWEGDSESPVVWVKTLEQHPEGLYIEIGDRAAYGVTVGP